MKLKKASWIGWRYSTTHNVTKISKAGLINTKWTRIKECVEGLTFFNVKRYTESYYK